MEQGAVAAEVPVVGAELPGGAEDDVCAIHRRGDSKGKRWPAGGSWCHPDTLARHRDPAVQVDRPQAHDPQPRAPPGEGRDPTKGIVKCAVPVEIPAVRDDQRVARSAAGDQGGPAAGYRSGCG